jgi:hypothetical protein
MKAIGLVIILAAVVGCTKQNPNLCCTDEADCAAQGLSNDSQCADGLLCRGNQCIAVTCAASSDCDASAPYCVDSSCAEACSGDEQCPGFGQSMASHCVAGACVECRTDATADCSGTTPVCASGVCRGCQSHDECTSGVCKSDGACADESDIAFVAANGSATSNCTNDSPCSLVRAFTVQPGKPYVLVSAGTYNTDSGVVVTGNHVVIGVGLVSIRRASAGPILTIGASTDVTLENVAIESATGTVNPDYGIGILCPSLPAASRIVRLKNVSVATCAASGIDADRCTIIAEHSSFRNNMSFGLNVHDGDLKLDASTIADNAGAALQFDSGSLSLTNSFIVRNGGGIDFYSVSTTNQIEFNTIADNGSAVAGLSCNLSNSQLSAPNNLFARNAPNTFGTKCTLPSSLSVDNDISAVHFKNPDASPFDYHLTSGSLAIDAATLSTIEHDFDGDARPNGAGRDVGADEFVP